MTARYLLFLRRRLLDDIIYFAGQATISNLLCVHGIILNEDFTNPNCQKSLNCAEVTYHVHNFLLADLAELSIMIAMTNSLINPFIYAMCSTEFRNQALGLVYLPAKRMTF